MEAFLAPFFIAFGIGAGLAILLTALGALVVIGWQGVAAVWLVGLEVARWPRSLGKGIRAMPGQFRAELARLRTDQAGD